MLLSLVHTLQRRSFLGSNFNLRCTETPDLRIQVGRVMIIGKQAQDTDKPSSYQHIQR